MALALAGLGTWLWTRGKETTDDAFVDGHVFQVTPRIAGFVTEVSVQDNQEVAEGQTLLRLDPTDYQVALAQARADLASAESALTGQNLGVPLERNQTTSRVASAKAQLASLMKSLKQAREEGQAAREVVSQALAEHAQTRLDLDRYETLRTRDVVAQADLDNTRTKFKTALAVLQQARARSLAADHSLASLEATVAKLQAEIDLAASGEAAAEIKAREAEAQAAKVDLARERVRQAELNLSYTRLAAPARGQVTRKKVEPGQFVAAGQPLLAVVPLNPAELWVTANFKESQLTDMRPGQAVRITVDAFPQARIAGRVDSVMAGTGSVFTLFPPENAAGNYVKVVQRVPVKIVLDPASVDLPPLKLGMSVAPTVFTR